MAPVKPQKLAKSEQEERITRALAKREEDGTPWATLALEFRVPASTLNDRWNGAQNRRDAHVEQQKLPPMVEEALEDWCKQLDDWGFPSRIDLLRGMANALAQQRAEQEGDPALGFLGRN